MKRILLTCVVFIFLGILFSLLKPEIVYKTFLGVKNRVIGSFGMTESCQAITYPNKKSSQIISFENTSYHVPNQTGMFIVVYRDDKILHLFSGSEIIREYQVNLRSELEDRKIWEDDQTPIGSFYIEDIAKVSRPNRCRWMRLNTLEKAKKIYQEFYSDGQKVLSEYESQFGIIETDTDIRKFNAQYKKQKLLRGIGVHGGGIGKYPWTVGCVSMDDDNIVELFDLIKSEFYNKKSIPIFILVRQAK